MAVPLVSCLGINKLRSEPLKIFIKISASLIDVVGPVTVVALGVLGLFDVLTLSGTVSWVMITAGTATGLYSYSWLISKSLKNSNTHSVEQSR
jgi:hypothetical protein